MHWGEKAGQSIASRIEHTLLRSDVSPAQIDILCEQARAHQFTAVCVPPYHVLQAVDALEDADVDVATVIGFPMGYSTERAKAEEVITAVSEGADDLDIVANIAAIRAGDWTTLESELTTCLRVCGGATIKIIVESGMLLPAELEACCRFYAAFPIDYLKTSTGFAAVGATLEAVQTMELLLPPRIKIKAAGGIRTFAMASALLAAGADRLGTSGSLELLEEESRFLS